MRSVLTVRRAFLAAVLAVAIATAVGLVLLWPHGDVAPLKFTEGINPGHAYSAEITAIAVFSTLDVSYSRRWSQTD